MTGRNQQPLSPTAAPPRTTTSHPDRPDHRHHNGDRHGKTLHIAPMMHYSTLEFRELFRILSKHCTLWTEMIVDETLFYTHALPEEGGTGTSSSSSTSIAPEHLLDPCHGAAHHPTICQIGGIRPEWTAVAARLIAQAGYHELNLNLGCPSSRVQGKQFGAVLMQFPETVVELLQAMRANFHHDKPISVKCRIGIEDPSVGVDGGGDGPTDWNWLESLIERLSTVCQRFVIHARSARLRGLSPTQNRNVPPLDYTIVYRLCRRFPDCDFWINGGIQNLKQAKDIVLLERFGGSENTSDNKHIDRHAVPCSLCGFANGSCIAPPPDSPPPNLRGAMLGRAAMEDPAQFWDVDRYWYGAPDNPVHTRREIVNQYCSVLERLYPRRCCDDCEQVTFRLPAPSVVHNKPFCSICDPAAFPATSIGDSFNKSNAQDDNSADDSSPAESPMKIGSVVIGRCMKPIVGLFVGIPGSRAFRHACDRVGRCPVRRNCGPAFLLRVAVAEAIADELLDQPLIRTEDLAP